jgi:hypothetical protein
MKYSNRWWGVAGLALLVFGFWAAQQQRAIDADNHEGLFGSNREMFSRGIMAQCLSNEKLEAFDAGKKNNYCTCTTKYIADHVSVAMINHPTEADEKKSTEIIYASKEACRNTL